MGERTGSRAGVKPCKEKEMRRAECIDNNAVMYRCTISFCLFVCAGGLMTAATNFGSCSHLILNACTASARSNRDLSHTSYHIIGRGW
jgi:hypothetical protein